MGRVEMQHDADMEPTLRFVHVIYAKKKLWWPNLASNFVTDRQKLMYIYMYMSSKGRILGLLTVLYSQGRCINARAFCWHSCTVLVSWYGTENWDTTLFGAGCNLINSLESSLSFIFNFVWLSNFTSNYMLNDTDKMIAWIFIWMQLKTKIICSPKLCKIAKLALVAIIE